MKKGNSDFQLVGDHHQLNAVTVPDFNLVSNLKDISANLHGCHIFSKVDLIMAYHQILMNSEDISKTAILYSLGSFEFLSMQFDLSNLMSTFQRFIDEFVCGLDFVFTYVITSDTRRESSPEPVSTLSTVVCLWCSYQHRQVYV